MEVNGYRDLATQKEIHRSLPPPKWSLNCEMGLMGWGGGLKILYTDTEGRWSMSPRFLGILLGQLSYLLLGLDKVKSGRKKWTPASKY